VGAEVVRGDPAAGQARGHPDGQVKLTRWVASALLTSSDGVPVATTRPRSTIATRSQSSSASSMKWVTSTTVAPSSLTRRTRSQVARRACGSSPVVSSSKNTTSGRLTRASAMNSRCCSPPDSLANGRRHSPSSPQRRPSHSSEGAPSRPRANSHSASPTRNRSGSADDCSCAPIRRRSRSPSRCGSIPSTRTRLLESGRCPTASGRVLAVHARQRRPGRRRPAAGTWAYAGRRTSAGTVVEMGDRGDGGWGEWRVAEWGTR
jgi:hypothetical protein